MAPGKVSRAGGGAMTSPVLVEQLSRDVTKPVDCSRPDQRRTDSASAHAGTIAGIRNGACTAEGGAQPAGGGARALATGSQRS